MPCLGHTTHGVDSEDIRRRLKAARALTAPTPEEIERRSQRRRDFVGITVDELATRLNEPGLGFKTLGAMERGDRDAQRRDLIVIAEALRLPLAFFTLDRQRLLSVIADAGAPRIPGETGRRLQGQRPTGEGPQQSENDEGEGRLREAGE